MVSNTSAVGDTQRALDAIRRIVQALRESSRWSERHVGLSAAQIFVLQTLAEVPGISVNDLAARTHTHQSSVSMVVTRLVEAGLVQRARSGRDARSVTLSLSARGRRAADRSPDVPQGRLIQAIEQLSAVRRRQLAAALSDVARALDSVEGAPSMFFEERGRGRRGAKHATRTS
jgi:DNA-binding MarR family transcriptional regulator